MNRRLPLALASLALLAAAPAAAQGVNQSRFLGAGQATKVSRALAGAQLRNQGEEASEGLGGDGCSQDLSVGNVVVPQGGRAPREVVTVIRGDVINVNRGFGGARCR